MTNYQYLSNATFCLRISEDAVGNICVNYRNVFPITKVNIQELSWETILVAYFIFSFDLFKISSKNDTVLYLWYDSSHLNHEISINSINATMANNSLNLRKQKNINNTTINPVNSIIYT